MVQLYLPAVIFIMLHKRQSIQPQAEGHGSFCEPRPSPLAHSTQSHEINAQLEPEKGIEMYHLSQDESSKEWKLKALDLPNTTKKLRVAYEILLVCRREGGEKRSARLERRMWARQPEPLKDLQT